MKKTSIYFLVAILLLVSTSLVLAAEGFTIALNRDFGYGGFGNQIQGTFSLKVQGEVVFENVIFMMDETVLGEDSEAPYKIQFSTDNYPSGEHVYWARGIKTDGTILESNRITGMVLSKEESGQGMFKIVGILVGGIAIVGVVTTLVTNRVSKGVSGSHSFESTGVPDGFSSRGGSVCPKCGKAFSFHFWRMNLLTHKVDRCPHCGKWVLVKSMTLTMLENAISSKISQNENKSVTGDLKDSENAMKKKLDDSRFMD